MDVIVTSLEALIRKFHYFKSNLTPLTTWLPSFIFSQKRKVFVLHLLCFCVMDFAVPNNPKSQLNILFS